VVRPAKIGDRQVGILVRPTETPLSEASSIAGVPGGGTLSGCSLETGRVGKEEHVGVENGRARGGGRIR
jgi:hypothetical protein